MKTETKTERAGAFILLAVLIVVCALFGGCQPMPQTTTATQQQHRYERPQRYAWDVETRQWVDLKTLRGQGR